LVSRSKDNGKGRRNVDVWQAKGGEYLQMVWKWIGSDPGIVKEGSKNGFGFLK